MCLVFIVGVGFFRLRVIFAQVTVDPYLDNPFLIYANLIFGNGEIVMHILVEFLVPVQNRQYYIQVVRKRNVSYVAQSGWDVLNVHFSAVRTRTELIGMLFNYESARYNVVLLTTPQITVHVEPEVLFIGPIQLVLIDEFASSNVF